jgi:transposase
MKIVIEASNKSFWVADQLEAMGNEVVVDPGRTKAIGAARIKHDRLDARVLAQICQAGLLAEVDRPSQPLRISRMSFTARDSLVRARVRLINTVRSLADSEGVEIPHCSARRFLDAVQLIAEQLPPAMAELLEPLCRAIEQLNEQIAACDARIRQVAEEDEQKGPDHQMWQPTRTLAAEHGSQRLDAVQAGLEFEALGVVAQGTSRTQEGKGSRGQEAVNGVVGYVA